MKTKKVSIGLDIGSSAVRAAEVCIEGDRRVLRRFGQVGLPQGAVVEGEVHDRAAVADALKRLWQNGGFSTKKVVVGLGSQRAMVRQVEMPPMSDADLRSALKFKIGEFLPIPVDQAVVDFAPLPGGSDGDNRRVLLVAAQRDVVVDEVDAVEAAGLAVRGVDSSSLALLRAVTPAGPGGVGTGLEAVVGIGSELVTVVVRQQGVPRFIRTVALSGSPGGQSAADALPGPPGDRGAPSRPRGGTGVSLGATPRLDAIVGEVRSSLEYLLSQTGTARFDHVLVTGGGSMLAGVTEGLSAAVGLPVQRALCEVELDRKSLALSDEALDEAASRWLSAVGLALWGTDGLGTPSLLPPETVERRKQHRVMFAAAAGLVVVAAGLGSVSLQKVHTASSIRSEVNSLAAESSALQLKINGVTYVVQLPAQVASQRELAEAALSGDVDWLRAMREIGKALPADVTPTGVTLSKSSTLTQAGATIVPGQTVGSMTMTATTKGGSAAVAKFIDRLSSLPLLSGLWVTDVNRGDGVIVITAGAQLTTVALSGRAADLPGGDN